MHPLDDRQQGVDVGALIGHLGEQRVPLALAQSVHRTIVARAQWADPCSGNERPAVPDHIGRRTLPTWLGL